MLKKQSKKLFSSIFSALMILFQANKGVKAINKVLFRQIVENCKENNRSDVSPIYNFLLYLQARGSLDMITSPEDITGKKLFERFSCWRKENTEISTKEIIKEAEEIEEQFSIFFPRVSCEICKNFNDFYEITLKTPFIFFFIPLEDTEYGYFCEWNNIRSNASYLYAIEEQKIQNVNVIVTDDVFLSEEFIKQSQRNFDGKFGPNPRIFVLVDRNNWKFSQVPSDKDRSFYPAIPSDEFKEKLKKIFGNECIPNFRVKYMLLTDIKIQDVLIRVKSERLDNSNYMLKNISYHEMYT